MPDKQEAQSLILETTLSLSLSKISKDIQSNGEIQSDFPVQADVYCHDSYQHMVSLKKLSHKIQRPRRTICDPGLWGWMGAGILPLRKLALLFWIFK